MSRPSRTPSQEAPLVDGERAALLALVRLEGMGPNRLRWLLETERYPSQAIAALRAGRLPGPDRPRPRGLSGTVAQGWFNQIRRIDGHQLLDDHRRIGVNVLAPADPDWPFPNDPEPPVILFVAGDVSALHHPLKAAIVGTRRCTSVGRKVAQGFGRDLTSAGVSVVSGLALGIDGSAHLGALASLAGAGGTAKPIGVVASGIDHVYPTKHADLWQEVIAKGVLISETPLGVAPSRWRFPARNRLIAGLSDVVIVVESHRAGGALLTVDEAAERGVPVLAVPGSVLAPSSVGTNALLLDGCAPVRSASDVTELLGLSTASFLTDASPTDLSAIDARHGEGTRRATPQSLDGRPVELLDFGLSAALVREVAAGPVHVDALVAATGRPLTEVLSMIRQLLVDERVVLDGNWVGPAARGGG